MSLTARNSDQVHDGAGHLFFRPQDAVLVSEGDAITGRVTSGRRLAGTRIIELDVGIEGQTQQIEIEVPLEAVAPVGADVRFRPKRWKVFGA